MPLKITGPKGGVIIRSITSSKLASRLPSIVKRFKKVQVTSAPTSTVVPKSNARTAVVNAAHWGATHSGAIHYAEIRPIPIQPAGKLPKLPLTTDCSGFATICYRYAKALDPNGYGYSGAGYTGSLLQHGKKIPRSKVRPGDLVVYGTTAIPTGHHVAVVVGVSKSTIWTVSHGQESGPFVISVDEEVKYQPAGITFLSFLP